MIFQLYQPSIMTAMGLKSGKKSKNFISGHFNDLKVTLKIKATDFKFFHRQILHIEVISNTV